MSFRLCWHSLALCAIITFLGLLEGCQAILPPGDRAHYVFHGDQRSPGEIRAAGGFLPRRQTRYHRPTTFSLLHYAQGRWNRAYVSTSTQFGQAAVNFAGAGNYVYRIHITPNMIDVNDVLSASSPFPSQREYAALGGIPWDAVQGWWRIPLSENSNIFSLFNNLVCGSNDAADLVTYRYERDYEPLFSPNADYDGERYVGSHVQTSADADASVLGATNIRQAIADLAGAAERFMHRHGSAVGWRAGQTFPLWVPVPGTEESRRRRCPSVSGSSDDDSNLPNSWPLGDDDVFSMAEVISDSAGGGNGCPEEANAVPPQLVAQLGNGIETLLDRNETDATQQGSLRKAGDALTGVGAACTVAAACSLLHGSGERSRRGVSVGWTPTLRAMCFKIWSQTSELKAWQYGGKQTRQTSSDCGRSLDAGSRVPYPPSCESFVGSDIYCQSQGKDEAACLFQRRAPTFFHGRDGSCNSDQLYFGMENCLGTEEWCNGWWISEKSNVTAKECLRRRASFNLDFNLPCVEIKNLRVDFSLRDGEKGARTGTVDNITLTMGRGNTLLAVAPPTGYSVSKSIDLEAAYGSKVVNLRQIDGAILIDQPNRNDLQPMWSFKGLTLTATCADSYDTVEIKKFRSVNRQIQHPGGSKALQVWSGRILPRDWRPMSTPEQPSTSGESTKSSTPRESARPSSQPIESAKLPTRIEDESRKPSPAAEATQRPPSNPPPRHDELKKFHNVDDPWHMMQGDNTGVTSSSSSSSSSSSPETENPHGNDRSRFPPDDEIETPAPIPSHRETIDCVEAGISWTNRDMNSRRVAEGFADCGRDDRPGESWRWWLGKYLIECKDGDDNCEVHQPDTMSDEAKGRAGQFGIPTQVPPTSEERDTVNPSTGRVTMDCVKAGVSWTIRNRHSRRVVNGIVDCGRADRPGESWRWWLGKYLVECKDHDKYCQVHQPDTMSDEAKRRANEFGIPTQLPPSEEEDLMLWHGLRRKRVGCQGMAWNDDDDERTRLVATGAAVCVRRDDPNMSWRWEDGKLVECRLKPINKVYHCRYHDPNNLPADVKARADSFFIPTTPPPTPPTMVMGA